MPMKKNKKPELLCPAGDLEKLKIAVLYGADAVYVGGEEYSLRAKAKNFSLEKMAEGIVFAHQHGVSVYAAVNIFASNEDLAGLKTYLQQLENIGVDALIVADPGVFLLAKETTPHMPIHISTQANNTNYKSANFWYQQGARRIVLARELSLKEIKEIRQNTPADLMLEAFVHGAMCISYSGRCLLSHYLSGRDANRGACSHPCRWNYAVVEESRPGEYLPIEEDRRGTYLFNSKDLCHITYIPELAEAGIDSFKIEGRMKTPFYVGTITKAYRQAIDAYGEDRNQYEANKENYAIEVKKASHRQYTTGFAFQKSDASSQIYDTSSYIRPYDFVGMIEEDWDEKAKTALLVQRNKFCVGDEVEVVPPKGLNFWITIQKMWNEHGLEIQEAPHAQQRVTISIDQPVQKFTMLRKKNKDCILFDSTN